MTTPAAVILLIAAAAVWSLWMPRLVERVFGAEPLDTGSD